nr:hypothetical protein [Tanacetum cinerariifolium]
MELYIQSKGHGRIILNSVENGSLIWPTIEQENGTVRPKTYEELPDKEKLQADCDLKEKNIILQGLPPDVYSLVNHHKVSKEIWDKVKLLMQGTSLSKQERECKLYDEFDKFTYVKGESLLPCKWSKFVTDVKLARDLHTSNYDQLYAYLEQHEAHDNEVHLIPSSNPRNKTTIQDDRVIVQQVQRRQGQNVVDLGSQGNASVAQIITHNAAFQTDDIDAYDSDCDDISSAKAVLMANLSSCDSYVLFEAPYSDTYQNDTMSQSTIL